MPKIGDYFMWLPHAPSEKLLVSGQVKAKKDGSPSMAGWLERLGMVIGLDQMKISGDMSEPKAIPLENYAGLLPDALPRFHGPERGLILPSLFSHLGWLYCPRQGDLLDPLPEGAPVTDETTRLREADPPQTHLARGCRDKPSAHPSLGSGTTCSRGVAPLAVSR